MTAPFYPGFEHDFHHAMYRYLESSGFQGSHYRAQTIEKAREEIRANFHLLEDSTPDTREQVISKSLFLHMYANSRSGSKIAWIRKERNLEYTEVVNMAIRSVKNLVYSPESKDNPTMKSQIIELSEKISSLMVEYEYYKIQARNKRRADSALPR